jgi:hypothetical protein
MKRKLYQSSRGFYQKNKIKTVCIRVAEEEHDALRMNCLKKKTSIQELGISLFKKYLSAK